MKSNGIHIINLKRIWEKFLPAAQAIESPVDVSVIGSRNTGQLAVLKFGTVIGATSIAGLFTPGTFTNQILEVFYKLRFLVITDPRAYRQPLAEATYVNLPTLLYVTLTLLCAMWMLPSHTTISRSYNNSVGLMWQMLAQEFLHMHSTFSCEHPRKVTLDLSYRNPEEMEKEEYATVEKTVTKEEFQGEWTAPAPRFTATYPEVADWYGVRVPSVTIQRFPLKTGLQPPTLRPLNEKEQPPSGPKLFFHRLLNKKLE